MPFVSIPKDTWTVVTTTATTSTLFQNRGAKNIYVATGSTAGLARNEGIELEPLQAVFIGTGLAVSARCVESDGVIFYTAA